MSGAKGWWIGVAVALLGAGCAGEGGQREESAPEPIAAAPAGADPAPSVPQIQQPGLPDTTTLTPAPAAAPPAAGSGTPPPAPQARGWTTGVVAARRPGVGVATLRAVRAARNEGFDRVVFQFDGDALPGYHLEYVDRPVRACGSGDAVPVAGDAWLEVRLEPARAHDDGGRATVTERARRPLLPNLRELRVTCDFEAQVVWVLGLRAPTRFRVLELRDPARLVVDVEH